FKCVISEPETKSSNPQASNKKHLVFVVLSFADVLCKQFSNFDAERKETLENIFQNFYSNTLFFLFNKKDFVWNLSKTEYGI
ncbi:hypothetical protein BpHYR1_001501, partial [Brachionus plicatilis]